MLCADAALELVYQFEQGGLNSMDCRLEVVFGQVEGTHHVEVQVPVADMAIGMDLCSRHQFLDFFGSTLDEIGNRRYGRRYVGPEIRSQPRLALHDALAQTPQIVGMR